MKNDNLETEGKGKPKYAIVGLGDEGKASALAEMALREKFGDDIIIVTADEAKEKGLELDQIANIPSYKITAPPIMEYRDIGPFKDGKAKRRERRKAERKGKK